jgi:hypothetical protein
MNSRYRRRWLVAFWGLHAIFIASTAVCVWQAPSWWVVPVLIVGYGTGFWAAVLVEIATG